MEYAKGHGAGWRSSLSTWLTQELGHTVFDPTVVSEKFLRRFYPGTNFFALKVQDLKRFRQILQRIVRLDLKEISARSDYVVCLWDQAARRGAGTKGEITLAYYLRKPVYIVTRQSPTRIPGWVIGCSTQIFRSMPELKRYLRLRFVDRAAL